MFGGGVHIQQQIAHDDGIWHDLMHWFGDKVGWEWIVAFIVISVLFFREKLVKLLPEKVRGLFK